MITFQYKARDGKGELVSDVITAKSVPDALRQLQRTGLTVIALNVGGSAPVSAADVDKVVLRQAAASIDRAQVIDFAEQVAIMLDSGVTLSEALAAYISQAKHRGMRRVASAVQERVIGGDTFSSALSQFPKVFPRLMVSLLEASEASGQMSEMLTRIAEYLDKDRQTSRQIKGALTYPAIMFFMAISVSGFLIAWVLPRFARIYAQREAALPAPTQFVLALSEGLRENWLTIALSVGAIVAVVIIALTTAQGKRFAHLLKVKLPVLGPIFTLYYLTRASRTLGTLLDAGVQLLDAVRIVRGVTNNKLWDELWDELEVNLTSGGTVAESVLKSSLLPPSSSQMIAAGERSGRLPSVLKKIANATDRDLDDAIKQGTQLIEPAMIILMGGLIGGLALALLLPIFTIARTMSG